MRFIVFELLGKYFGLSIDHVREVLKTPALTPLPQSPEFIEGVLFLRGHNVAAMDLRKRLDLFEDSGPKSEHVMMVKVQKMIIGLLVDRVVDIFDIPTESIDRTAQKDNAWIAPQAVTGLAQVNGQTALLLNIETLMDAKESFALKKVHS
jgi:purine-binding chemotaxis protein CheW